MLISKIDDGAHRSALKCHFLALKVGVSFSEKGCSTLVFILLFVNIVVFILSCISTLHDHSYKDSLDFFLQPFTGKSLESSRKQKMNFKKDTARKEDQYTENFCTCSFLIQWHNDR